MFPIAEVYYEDTYLEDSLDERKSVGRPIRCTKGRMREQPIALICPVHDKIVMYNDNV
jgi:hypothetical protein